MWCHLPPLSLEGCKDTHMGTAVTRAGVNSIQIQSLPIPGAGIYLNSFYSIPIEFFGIPVF